MADLRSRMAVTLAAVLAIDLAFAVVVAVLLEPWIAPALDAAGVDAPVGRYVALVGIAVAGLVPLQLAYTRLELFAEADAAPITPDSHPVLHARVTRLASLADVRVPEVAVADTDVPNSFAIGGVRSGTVVVSEGLLETLPDDELDAVLAHELAHLENRDAVVMTLASFLPALVADEHSPIEAAVPDGARPALWGAVLVGSYGLGTAFIDAPPLSAASLLQFGAAVAVTVLVGGVALGLLATPVVFLSRRLSRTREFVADRDGARLVGDPAALASALSSLDEADQPPSTDARTRYAGLDGLCLLPYGFASEDDDGPVDRAGETFAVETRSHPPTADRIARLRDLAAAIETA